MQGYVYAARRAGAVLAAALGHAGPGGRSSTRQAEALRERFEEAFWCEDLATYALALDGDKRPCRVRTSNAGQCLFTGIAAPDRAARVARGLLPPEFFSGWGIRTVAATEARYNPMGYHNGSVWPHDNALIAYGAVPLRPERPAAAVLAGLFEAGTYFDLHRMPELFCGFDREPGEGPVPYPVACAPQAWSAASVFLLLAGLPGPRRQWGRTADLVPPTPAALPSCRSYGSRTWKSPAPPSISTSSATASFRIVKWSSWRAGHGVIQDAVGRRNSLEEVPEAASAAAPLRQGRSASRPTTASRCHM